MAKWWLYIFLYSVCPIDECAVHTVHNKGKIINPDILNVDVQCTSTKCDIRRTSIGQLKG
jgi:hypothetical protein